MMRVSPGFKARILGSESFATIFRYGTILVFDSVRPAAPEELVLAAPVGYVSVNGLEWSAPDNVGAGLQFVLNGDQVGKPVADRWVMNTTATTTLTWGRLVGREADDQDVSYTLPRIDFDVGLVNSGAELILPALEVTAGGRLTVDAFMYTIPPAQAV